VQKLSTVFYIGTAAAGALALVALVKPSAPADGAERAGAAQQSSEAATATGAAADRSQPAYNVKGAEMLEASPIVGGDKGEAVKVTTLDDHGPGSLREAVERSGARLIMFKVAGTIRLESDLVVRNPFVTIAGETAPDPGITLVGEPLRIRGHDVIVRHIRVRIGSRLGHSPAQNRDGISIDGAANGSKPAYNILIDHCSISWAIDENLAIYGPGSHNIIVRDSIIAEALWHSIHPKGQHSMGLLVGPQIANALITGNLIMSNAWRNPVVSAGANAIIVNNFIYNPGKVGLHYYSRRNPSPTRVAAVGNVLVAGPDTKPMLRAFGQPVAPGSQLYYADNLVEGTRAFDTSEARQAGVNPFIDHAPIWRRDVVPMPAGAVRASVLKSAGARPWDRDATDRRLIAEAKSGGGRIPDTAPEPGL